MLVSAKTEKIKGVGFITKSLIAEMMSEPETYRARLSARRKRRAILARCTRAEALHWVAWIREFEPNWTHSDIEERLAKDGTTGEPNGKCSELVHKLMDAGCPGRYMY